MRPSNLIRLALIVVLAWITVARADTIPARSAELRLEEDHYVLDAEFDLALNATLEEATRLISRVRGRKVIEKAAVIRNVRYEAQVRLRLDVTQLPKPFQISALTSREWNLQSEWVRWSFVP